MGRRSAALRDSLRLQVLGLAGKVFQVANQRRRAHAAYVEAIGLAKALNEDLIDQLLDLGELLLDERNFAGALGGAASCGVARSRRAAAASKRPALQ